MWHKLVSGILVVASVVALVLVSGRDASAGQFKRLNAQNLTVGQLLAVHASPLNQGNAMEMDTYEVLSATAGGAYRFRITSNATGQTLNLKVIGVNGTIVGSCSAPNGSSCLTPTLTLVGNLLFQVIVATNNGAPVLANAHYTFAVQRQ